MADFTSEGFCLNDNKAGLSQMDGHSKEDIAKILTKHSEGSKFYENKKQRHQAIEERIAQKKKVLQEASAADINDAVKKTDKMLSALEASRDLSRVIVHVDMDMFYAAVEVRDAPHLKDKPVAVGGNSMLSTSNYVARKFGVRAAQPGFLAKKLCPNLIIVPCNFPKYRAVAAIVRGVFAEYDRNYASASLDEAYLDITDHLNLRSKFSEKARTLWRCDCEYWRSADASWTPAATEVEAIPPDNACPDCGRRAERLVMDIDAEGAVLELRTKVFRRTALTCSAGIAPNSKLAKICTDRNKPDGQYRLPPTKEAVADFVRDLPVRKIPGIGAATEETLRALGVQTCSDLQKHRASMALVFSDLSTEYFMRVSLGIGCTTFSNDEERKSISNERTFRDMWKPEELYAKLKELSEDLAESMEEANICGKTVSIKIKLVTFEVRTRAQTVARLIYRAEDIYPVAKKLLDHEIKEAKGKLELRLMGVRLSQLQPMSALENSHQPTLSKFLQRSPTKVSPSTSKGNSSHVHSDEENTLSIPEEIPKNETVIAECPNCGKMVESDKEFVKFNTHIDECLNRSLLQSEKRESPSETAAAPPAKRKLRLDDVSTNRTSTKPKLKGNSKVSKKITDYLKPC